MIRITADSQIPEIENSLAEFLKADYSIDYFDSNTLTACDLKNTDALLVRSTLSVNQALCQDTKISFVASATAGINHLDIDYLDSKNISWSYAPGCNAFSVIHYVLAAIGELIKDGMLNVRQSIGIVGYGNIGKRLYKLLKALNFEVYACDPFLANPELVSLDKVLACDLVTIHVPLSASGQYPTLNIINESHIEKLSNKILINTSRGEVVSEELVLQSQDLIYIADVWMNEPSPSLKMIETSYIATPHIAGYSIEGRLNGAKIIAKECAKIFKCLKPSETKTVQPSAWPYDLNNIVRDIHNVSFPISLFSSELDLKSISDSFKKLSIANLESGFRFQRESHSPRNDFNSFSFKGISELDQELDLGFFNELGGA